MMTYESVWVIPFAISRLAECSQNTNSRRLSPARRLHVWHYLILSPALNNERQGTSWDPEVAGGCGSGFPHVSYQLTSISSVPLLPYFIFEHFYNLFSLTSFILSIHTPCITDRKCVVWCYPVLLWRRSDVQNWHSMQCAVHFLSMVFRKLSAPLYAHWGSVQAVRPIGGVEVYLYSFMTTALEGGEVSASRPRRSSPPGKTGTHCTGGWVDSRVSLDSCGKSRPHRDSILGPSSQ
jgi:hypothetical protein